MKRFSALLAVLFVSFFLFTYKLTKVPPGLNGDEYGIGYNAKLISESLTDENNNFLPLFVYAKSSDWKQPISVYVTAVVFKIIGVSFYSLRLTSVLFVLVSILVLYYLALSMFGKKYAIFSVLIFATTPIILIQSHLAIENIAPIPFVLIFLWAIYLTKQDKYIRYSIASGAILGLSLFSYFGMRAMVPVILVASLLYIRNRKKIILVLLGFSPLLILLVFGHIRYPGAVLGSYSAEIPSLYTFLYRYLSIFDISFLFFEGDITPYHSTGYFGMLLLPTLPAFIYSIYDSIVKKKEFNIYLILTFFLIPILFGFVPDIHRSSRLLALVPFYTLLSAYGLTKMKFKYALFILILILTSYGFFVLDYWNKYPERVKDAFAPSSANMQDYKFNTR